MIQWIDEEGADDVVKANLDRFRRTSFAKNLEEDKTTWRLMSWPRSADSPLRFLLRSDRQKLATFTIDGDGREYGDLAE